MKHYDYIEADDSYDMAVEWFKNGNYEKAEHYFKKTLDINDKFVYAYIALARLYAKQSNFSEAVRALKNASHIDPVFDRLYFLMAKYAYKGGDYKNALIFINKAIVLNNKELYVHALEIIENRYRMR